MDFPVSFQFGKCEILSEQTFERNKYVKLSNLPRRDLEFIQNLEDAIGCTASKIYEETLTLKIDDGTLFFDEDRNIIESHVEPGSMGIPLIEFTRMYTFDGKTGLICRLAQFMVLSKKDSFVLGD
jgi:hypothetical protein